MDAVRTLGSLLLTAASQATQSHPPHPARRSPISKSASPRSNATTEGRYSLCYDGAALASRKEHKPKDSAMELAKAMGIEILTEEQYTQLQTLGEFDTKTSSWVKTPDAMRKLGGALFGDCRFGRVFFYHNCTESYFSDGGFRGCLKV